MSVALPPWGLSNPRLEPWVVTVVVIIVIKCSAVAQVVGACADALGLVSVLFAYAVQQPSAVTARTADALSDP